MKMKYFEIEESAGNYYRWEDVVQRKGFKKILNCEEKRKVLEEQLRPFGLQPIVDMSNTGISIITAPKKFMKRERRYNCVMSKRAQEYIEFCESLKDVRA